MATFTYNQLSDHPTVKAVTKRLGLVGYARLIKIIEECTDAGQVAMSWSDWLSTLDCTRDQFDDLLAVFAKLGAFRASQAEGVSAPLMLTMGQPLQFLLAKPDSATVIHTRAEQWESWIKTELCSPSWLVKDESTQALFRHWCASNVSIAEVTSALELAALANDLSPVGIHEKIKTARASRLVQARTRA
jgi:hypothetical protein